MDLGHSSDNTRRYVHISELAKHLGSILCKALPGYHALTGCDYTSSFFRKGKVNPFKKAEQSASHLDGLGNLGENSTFIDDDNLVESYVCLLYGQGALSSVNEARWKTFLQKYKPRDPDSTLEKIKGIDPGMLPPCRDVLVQKRTRSKYVTYMWKNGHQKDPLANVQPTDHGWKEVNGVYLPISPGTMHPDDLVAVEDDDDDDHDYDSDEASDEEDDDVLDD